MKALQIDENLITRVAAGDSDAFNELFRQTKDVVYGYALATLGSMDDAEAVMREAYAGIYSGAVSYRPAGEPLRWILNIVKDICNKRSGSVRTGGGQAAAAPGSPEAVQNTVMKLGREERQVVMMHALTGLRHREIAGLLGVPAGIVLSKFTRALRKIKEELPDSGGMTDDRAEELLAEAVRSEIPDIFGSMLPEAFSADDFADSLTLDNDDQINERTAEIPELFEITDPTELPELQEQPQQLQQSQQSQQTELPELNELVIPAEEQVQPKSRTETDTRTKIHAKARIEEPAQQSGSRHAKAKDPAKSRGLGKIIAACVAVLVLAAAGFLLFNKPAKAAAVVGMDVNLNIGAIELSVDESGKVIEVTPFKKGGDGEELIKELDLKGTDIDAACSALTGKMIEKGYLSQAYNSVLVYVSTEDAAKGQDLVKRAADSITAAGTGSGTFLAVLGQYIESDENLESFAHKNNISLGKAWLIRRIIDTGGIEKTEDSMLLISTDDLMLLAKARGVTSDCFSGDPAMSGYLSKDEAIDKARIHADLSLGQLTGSDAQLDCDGGSLVYDVNITAYSSSYEYEISASTGEVIGDPVVKRADGYDNNSDSGSSYNNDNDSDSGSDYSSDDYTEIYNNDSGGSDQAFLTDNIDDYSGNDYNGGDY